MGDRDGVWPRSPNAIAARRLYCFALLAALGAGPGCQSSQAVGDAGDASDASDAGDAGAGPDGRDGGDSDRNHDGDGAAEVGPSWGPVTGVAAGTNHTCAVHQGGRVSCWGYGPFIGPGLPAVVAPRAVDLPAPALAIQLGIQAGCALLQGGAVSCWGDLGRGPEAPGPVLTEQGTPLQAVTVIAGGSLAFCASSPAGIHCWGDNKGGELARRPALSFPPRTAVLVDTRPRPLLAAGVAMLVHDGVAELCGWGSNDSGIVPGPPGIIESPACRQGLTGLLSLSAGDGHLCARRSGPDFSCWGSNSGGQLGIGDDGVLDVALPGRTVTLPAAITDLVSAAYHTCAALQTGAVLCWGSNEHGELGVAPSAPRFDPRPVAGLSGRVVALGAGAGAQHTCAVLQDGALECWGYDNAGQLGGGATGEDADRFSATPVRVRF